MSNKLLLANCYGGASIWNLSQDCNIYKEYFKLFQYRKFELNILHRFYIFYLKKDTLKNVCDFKKSKSLTYGVTFLPNSDTVLSCSFYDKYLCAWTADFSKINSV